MGSIEKWPRKNAFLKNIWLILFLAVALFATVGLFVALRLGKDTWMDYYLVCSPLFVTTYYLCMLIGEFLLRYMKVSIMIEIIYYALWIIVASSAMLAVRGKRIWKYIVYLLFAFDAFVNLLIPSVSAVVSIVMLTLFALSLKQSVEQENDSPAT